MSTTNPVPSTLGSFFAFLAAELKVEFIPIAIGALQILQKNPNSLGLAAANAYVLANAPAALLAAETAAIGSGGSSILGALQGSLAAAQAQLAAGTSGTAA